MLQGVVVLAVAAAGPWVRRAARGRARDRRRSLSLAFARAGRSAIARALRARRARRRDHRARGRRSISRSRPSSCSARSRPPPSATRPARRTLGIARRHRRGHARSPRCRLLCALRLGADQVIVGIALNLLALGGTRFLLQLLYRRGRELAAGAVVRRRRSPATRSCGSRVLAAIARAARDRAHALGPAAARGRRSPRCAASPSACRPARTRLRGRARRRRARRRGRRAALARRSAASSPTCRAAAATSRSRW